MIEASLNLFQSLEQYVIVVRLNLGHVVFKYIVSCGSCLKERCGRDMLDYTGEVLSSILSNHMRAVCRLNKEEKQEHTSSAAGDRALNDINVLKCPF